MGKAGAQWALGQPGQRWRERPHCPTEGKGGWEACPIRTAAPVICGFLVTSTIKPNPLWETEAHFQVFQAQLPTSQGGPEARGSAGEGHRQSLIPLHQPFYAHG